jgi:Kef-type K+ transport system membrane component KefB
MEMLYVLLVLLLVTRLFGELAVRVGQPVLVGELISGITLGVLTQHFSGTFPVLANLPENEIFDFVTNLAMFFLMLLAGTEMRPRDLAGSSGAAVFVAAGGLALPMALGFALGWVVLPNSQLKLAQSLFLATALAITAVPVTVKVLLDLRQLQTRLGQTIVSAAVFDDILSLLLLAILTAVIETGGFPEVRTVLAVLGEVSVFFVVTLIVGRYIFPWAGRLVKGARADEFGFSALLIGALGLALLAEALGMHFIIGAFAGGLFFVRQTIDDKVYEAVQARLSGITSGFLAPLFFASIGMHLELGAATTIPGFLGALILIAFFGKLLGSAVPAYWRGFPPREAVAVGVGMSARGAVELIIADIALRAGLFLQPEPVPAIIEHMFSAVVIMALATTLLTPPILKQVMDRKSQ